MLDVLSVITCVYSLITLYRLQIQPSKLIYNNIRQVIEYRSILRNIKFLYLPEICAALSHLLYNVITL